MLSEADYRFEVDWENYSESAYDVECDRIWGQKMKDGLFRYALDGDETRLIIGERNSYFVQLNVNRDIKKRETQPMENVRQTFDESKFNFTQISDEEVMFRIRDGDHENLIAINVSPLDRGHSLLLPSVYEKLPQILTSSGLEFAIRVVLSSHKPTMRAGFNGLLGYATVNHLHFHVYHLGLAMPLEKTKVTNLAGRCYILDSYPSKGFAFQICSVADIKPVVDDIVRVSEVFLDHQLPHNLYITRGLRFDNRDVNSSKRDCLRVFLWARKSSSALKDLASNPAFCQLYSPSSRLLFGHFLVKDSQIYENIDENFLETTLTTLTCESFQKALPLVRSLFGKE